jgi:hypothetical protein
MLNPQHTASWPNKLDLENGLRLFPTKGKFRPSAGSEINQIQTFKKD